MRYLVFHRGLLLLAGLILCLHTVFPHVHTPRGGEGNVVVFAERPASERSFLEVLYDLVTADLGEEHLENFSPADSDGTVVLLSISPANPVGNMFFAFEDQTGIPQKGLKEIIVYHPLLPEEEALARQRPLRGPPSVG